MRNAGDNAGDKGVIKLNSNGSTFIFRCAMIVTTAQLLTSSSSGSG
jgi:hypothetical protein